MPVLQYIQLSYTGFVTRDEANEVTRYDAIRDAINFNVQSKADINELNLPHGTNNNAEL